MNHIEEEKICQMCAVKSVNYKDVDIIKKYINEKYKIVPRRVTGACAKHQRYIATQVKERALWHLFHFQDKRR